MFKIFGNEELALAFTFQSKYLGMSPWNCPGLFAIIPYIEHAFGIYHPIGGLSKISDSMADVAREHGAEIHLGTPVERVLVEDRKAVGVRLAGGEELRGDEIVINADFGYAMTHLFEPGEIRKYTPAKLSRMALSCSTFMLYLGLDKVYDLPHHTIFFARDYRDNVEAVFEGREVWRRSLALRPQRRRDRSHPVAAGALGALRAGAGGEPARGDGLDDETRIVPRDGAGRARHPRRDERHSRAHQGRAGGHAPGLA